MKKKSNPNLNVINHYKFIKKILMAAPEAYTNGKIYYRSGFRDEIQAS